MMKFWPISSLDSSLLHEMAISIQQLLLAEDPDTLFALPL
jgi:hypothetical protein